MDIRLVSVVSTRQTINLAVSCVCPPIPDRRYDWSAYDVDADGCDGCHVGYGQTAADAIQDLLAELSF